MLYCQYCFLIYFKDNENYKHQFYYSVYIILINNQPKGAGKTELIKQIAQECKALLVIVNVSMIIEVEEQKTLQELTNQIE